MIESIKIENFKSLKSVDLSLGRFNLFIGTNASGKSNFFDALRFLQGIGNGFTYHEILDGKPKSATSEVWEGIRGGSNFAPFRAPEKDARVRVPPLRFKASFNDDKDERSMVFETEVAAIRGCVRQETLKVDGSCIYTSDPTQGGIFNDIDSPFFEVRYYRGTSGRQPHLRLEKSRAIIHQLARQAECSPHHSEIVSSLARKLANMQRIDPSPAILRGYSMAHEIKRMGEHGENFAALIKTILSSDGADAYVEWLKELRPAEVEKITTLDGAVGEPMFAIKETGRAKPFPAPVLSDGTLRFAAITAAFFQPDMPGVLTIEEIENGIHPGRMRLLLELLRNRAGQVGTQVMATTHSPWLLDWLTEEEWEHTFFCHRDAESGASTITPLTELPGFDKAAKLGEIGQLLAEGWMDFAL